MKLYLKKIFQCLEFVINIKNNSLDVNISNILTTLSPYDSITSHTIFPCLPESYRDSRILKALEKINRSY